MRKEKDELIAEVDLDELPLSFDKLDRTLVLPCDVRSGPYSEPGLLLDED